MKLTIELDGNLEKLKEVLDLKGETPKDVIDFLADRAKQDGCNISDKSGVSFKFTNEIVGLNGEVKLELE